MSNNLSPLLPVGVEHSWTWDLIFPATWGTQAQTHLASATHWTICVQGIVCQCPWSPPTCRVKDSISVYTEDATCCMEVMFSLLVDTHLKICNSSSTGLCPISHLISITAGFLNLWVALTLLSIMIYHCLLFRPALCTVIGLLFKTISACISLQVTGIWSWFHLLCITLFCDWIALLSIWAALAFWSSWFVVCVGDVVIATDRHSIMMSGPAWLAASAIPSCLFVNLIEQNTHELAIVESLDNGKPLSAFM